jgi:hypothetical protein
MLYWTIRSKLVVIWKLNKNRKSKIENRLISQEEEEQEEQQQQQQSKWYTRVVRTNTWVKKSPPRRTFWMKKVNLFRDQDSEVQSLFNKKGFLFKEIKFKLIFVGVQSRNQWNVQT